MRFGIHVPKQRNLTATVEYAREIGCQAIQIFSGNPVGWSIGRLDPDDRAGFVRVTEEADIGPVMVHTPYLINLATSERKLRGLSRRALVDALTRTHELRAGLAVVHSGNHMGKGTEVGIERAIETIAWVLDRAPEDTRLLIENGSGKGTEIAVSFRELRRMVEPFPAERVGVLLDTAHLWALGYDLRKEGILAAMIEEFDAEIGLTRLAGIHGNDSLAECGSHRDVHALWTEGRMGRPGLRNLVRAPAFSHLPFVFEIPGETPEFDRKRLASMRRLERRLARGPRGSRERALEPAQPS
jgi:deoxyribonuclease-4